MSQKNQTFTTPAGTTGFTCITKPSTKFKPEGEYSVDLILTPEEAAPLKAQLTQAAEAAKAEKATKEPKVKAFALHVPGNPYIDRAGNDTGNLSFKFKQAAVVTPKTGGEPFETKIGIFDAKGKPMDKSINVGGGSRVKVAFQTVPFANPATRSVGVSLRLKAVQVLDLKTFNGGTADSYGFGEEEGYTAEEAPEGAAAEEAPAGAGTGDF